MSSMLYIGHSPRCPYCGIQPLMTWGELERHILSHGSVPVTSRLLRTDLMKAAQKAAQYRTRQRRPRWQRVPLRAQLTFVRGGTNAVPGRVP